MKRLERLVTAVSQRGIPSYGIIVPIVYDSEDIPDIVELSKCTKTLSGLLEDTVQKWNATSRFAANADGETLPKTKTRIARSFGGALRIENCKGRQLPIRTQTEGKLYQIMRV